MRNGRDGRTDERKERRGTRWLSLAIGTGAVALALFLLVRTLGQYEYDELVRSVRAVEGSHLALAGLFAALSYLCLTGFDFLALRYAGHPLSWPRAALASFVALSLGHNIGFAALSSGAIRYRFYARWGLGIEDVAKVILFCGITVGLGLIVLCGAALLLHPDLAESMLGVGRATVHALAGACLAAALAWLGLAAWLRAPLRLGTWSFRMPPLRLAFGQLVIGPLNFAFVAAALHQTISSVAEIPYAAVASAYVTANVAALITHAPGGLGVIESVVVFLLPQAGIIGAVLVFRFVYFLVPLLLGLALLGLSEAAARKRRPQRRSHRPA